MREAYMRALLKQEVAFYDVTSAGVLITQVCRFDSRRGHLLTFSDTLLIQEAIGEKLATGIQFFATFVGGFVVGFVRGWKLTLVMAATTPLVAVSGGMFMVIMANMTTRGQAAYAKAGAFATELLSGIRTVASFGAEERSIDKYSELLSPATKIGEKRNFLSGLAIGIVFLVFYCTYALALWYGAKLTVEEDYTGGKTLEVFFAVIMGSFALGQFGQTAEAIAKGQGSGYKLFKVIERKSLIDSSSDEGNMIDVQGHIELKVTSY